EAGHRRGAHGCQIAERRDVAAVARVLEREPAPIEVHALDRDVDREHRAARHRRQHRGVITDPDGDASVADREPLLDLGEERELVHHSSVTSGSVKRNVLPCPGALSTQTWPPWASTSRLTIESPSPVPPCSRVL